MPGKYFQQTPTFFFFPPTGNAVIRKRGPVARGGISFKAAFSATPWIDGRIFTCMLIKTGSAAGVFNFPHTVRAVESISHARMTHLKFVFRAIEADVDEARGRRISLRNIIAHAVGGGGCLNTSQGRQRKRTNHNRTQ